MAIEQVLVGVDGSAAARRAWRFAVELAGQVGASVVVVHARGLLEGAAARAGEVVPDPGVGVRLVEGDPVGALLQLAEELDVDLIVVGSRGIGGRPELLLGSTSTQLAQRSTRPVVIVPSA